MSSPGPWMLLTAVLVGAGVGVVGTILVRGDRPTPSATDEAAFERIADLEREVATLREGAACPTLAPSGAVPSASPTSPPVMNARPAPGGALPTSTPSPASQPKPTASKPFKQAETWIEALRGVAGPRDDHPALGEMRAALSGQSGVAAEAVLIALEGIDVSALDRATWRGILEPYARSPNFAIRRGAAVALHRIDPRPDDVERALAELRSAARFEAERSVETLVLMADGVVEGAVADAVLHVLRDGTDIPRCFVMRGVASGKLRVLDPRVVARMVEIAGGVPPQDYDSFYFLYFVAPRLEPRPDAVVELAMRVLTTPGPGSHRALVLALSGGLEGPARSRVLARLLSLVESSPDGYVARRALEVVKALGGRDEAAAVDRVAEDSTRPGDLREAAKAVADILRFR